MLCNLEIRNHNINNNFNITNFNPFNSSSSNNTNLLVNNKNFNFSLPNSLPWNPLLVFNTLKYILLHFF